VGEGKWLGDASFVRGVEGGCGVVMRRDVWLEEGESVEGDEGRG